LDGKMGNDRRGLAYRGIRNAEEIKEKGLRAIDTLGWTGVAVALITAIVLDKSSTPHKWHAAIMWTVVTLLGVLKFGQRKWNFT
jgi:hypothetical protein